MSAQRRHGSDDGVNDDGPNDDSITSGGAGDDVMNGSSDRDRFFGDSGDDRLSGGDDRDRLWGGDGDDILDGGADRDRMRGGAGADIFVFAPGDGEDRIRDFEVGVDKIDLSAYGLADASAILANAENHNDYIELMLGGDDSIRLYNVDPGELTASDFIL